jgi:CRISPR-associated protein Cas2
MDYVLCYDIDTSTRIGERRLRKVAKACEGYGVRVQKSVFECVLTEADRLRLLHTLKGIIDQQYDQVSLYPLHRDARETCDRLGAAPLDIRDPLVL